MASVAAAEIVGTTMEGTMAQKMMGHVAKASNFITTNMLSLIGLLMLTTIAVTLYFFNYKGASLSLVIGAVSYYGLALLRSFKLGL